MICNMIYTVIYIMYNTFYKNCIIIVHFFILIVNYRYASLVPYNNSTTRRRYYYLCSIGTWFSEDRFLATRTCSHYVSSSSYVRETKIIIYSPCLLYIISVHHGTRSTIQYYYTFIQYLPMNTCSILFRRTYTVNTIQ